MTTVITFGTHKAISKSNKINTDFYQRYKEKLSWHKTYGTAIVKPFINEVNVILRNSYKKKQDTY